MGPFLLADGSPQWLSNILKDPAVTRETALVGSLVILMFELGFNLEHLPHNNSGSFDIARMGEAVPAVSALAVENGRYTFTFCLHGALTNIFLVVVPLGPELIVNLMIPGVKVLSFVLTIANFVVSDVSGLSVKNHSELSTTCREQMLSAKALMIEPAYNPHHIFHLPFEILSYIFKHLTSQEFATFGLTCKTAAELSCDDNIWKHLAKQYFPARKLNPDETWKAFVIYQIKHQRALEHELYLGHKPPLDHNYGFLTW